MALKPNLYTGPEVPATFDPRWQTYNNLTPNQILAFQAFPEDLIPYIKLRRWMTEISVATTPDGIRIDMSAESQAKISGLLQAANLRVLEFPLPFLAVGAVKQLSSVADIAALYAFVVRRVQATYAVAARLIDGVNTQHITSRTQVDAAFGDL